MQELIIDIILVVAVVAIATLALILLAEWLMTTIGNKGNKKAKKSKNDSKNQGKLQEDYFYNENANLEDDEKFLLNLDDDESNVNDEKSAHYDEAQAEKEKALALKDKGNDIDHFSEPTGFGAKELDNEYDDETTDEDKKEDDDDNTISDDKEEDDNKESLSTKTKEKGTANPFLFDDSEEDNEVKLNKGDNDTDKPVEEDFNIVDDENSSQDNNYSNDSQDNLNNEQNNTDISNNFLERDFSDESDFSNFNINGEQQFRFEDENDTISPNPKSADKNLETPSDEELIDFINQKALEDYEMSTNSLNPFSLNNNSPIDYNDVLNDDNDNDNEINEQIMQKDAMILRLQEELNKTKEDKNQEEVVKITPINETVTETPIENNSETKTQEELNRDRIRAEVNKQMQINKLAEKEEYYREQIKKLQEQHAEELRKVQEQNSEELKKVQEQSNEELKKIYDQNKLLNEQIESSRQEMENKLKSQIDLLTTSKDQMASDFKDQIERINSNNEEQQNIFINEINQLKEQLQNASNSTIQELPVEPIPVVEEVKEVEEEQDFDLPKKTDPKYEELIIKIQNLETRLRAVNKSLRNNKKEYVPLIKAQKYINDNNDRFNRKSNNVAKLKAQLSKPKYADDKEKLAKYDSEMEIYEQLRIDMTRNKEYLDLNASKIPILEKENATLTKQQTELENQLNILRTELKRYE